MFSYLIRRMFFLLAVVWGAMTIVFVLSQVVPADPVRAALGPDATTEMVEHYRDEMGLDKPLAVQYVYFMSNLAKGDIGRSILSGQEVSDDLKRFVPATLELMIPALLLSVLIGIPLGITSAVYRGRAADHITRAVSIFGMSLPVFWFGLVLQLTFYKYLKILPAGGRLGSIIMMPPSRTGFLLIDSLLAGDFVAFGSAFSHIILPAIALTSIGLAAFARITRSSMLEVLRQDYIRTARSKGLSERVVLYKHAFINASLPIITVIGLRIGRMLGGAVLTETIFSWPGLGRYAFNAITQMDYPVVVGFTIWTTMAYAIVNLLVDLSYYFLDPRIRYH